MTDLTSAKMHRRTKRGGAVDNGVMEGWLGQISNLHAWWPAYKQPYLADELANCWFDFSGNNRHGTAVNGATFKTSIINGYPVYRFNSDAIYYLGEAFDLDQATYFVVWSRVNAANNDVILSTGGATPYAYLQYGTSWYFYNLLFQTVAMPASTFYLKCAKYDNVNVTLYTNGTQDASPAQAVNCGFTSIGSTGVCQGDIAEIILYSKALNDSERGIIETMLNRRYALW